MSEGENIGGESAQPLLLRDLDKFCRSDLLSEERLRELFDRHGLTPNNNYPSTSDYTFFFNACCDEIDEGIIRCLLEYFPDAASATDDRSGWSPLHFACGNESVTLKIIQLLINAAPESVRSVSKNLGQMPLHSLCFEKGIDEAVSMEIAKLLIEKHPAAVRHADNYGRLPILLASMAKSLEFCRLLIEAFPGSERISDVEGMLPLHHACLSRPAATVEYLYKLYPDAINHTHAKTDGLYPIHFAIGSINEDGDPERVIEVVNFLLDCDPNVKLQKFEGQTLLNLACLIEYGSKVEAGTRIIKAIYNAYPEAIEDNIVEPANQYCHPQVLSFIMRQSVYARRAKDRHQMNIPDDTGRLPLHKELRINVILGSIKLLVKGNPHALQSPDNGGVLPLHIACQYHESARVVKYLVGLDMTTLGTVDREGNTAMHYACRGAKYQTIAMLLDEFDAVSVSKRNAEKKLPIDLLWESNAVEDRESVDYMECVFRLLKAYPETVVNVGNEVQSDLRRERLAMSKKRKFDRE